MRKSKPFFITLGDLESEKMWDNVFGTKNDDSEEDDDLDQGKHCDIWPAKMLPVDFFALYLLQSR